MKMTAGAKMSVVELREQCFGPNMFEVYDKEEACG